MGFAVGGILEFSIDANNSHLFQELTISGDSDSIQLHVQGNSTQTKNILVVENSGGTDLFVVDSSDIWAYSVDTRS